MEPGTALGSTGLAISILTNGPRVIEFLVEWVKTSKQYGDDARVIRTRLSSQSARLGAFTAFLKQETTPGSSHYSEMSGIFQRSVSGMIQELELAFDAYQGLINKYQIDDLRRGYDVQMSIEDSGGNAQTKARMVDATKKESGTKQKAASYMGAAAWAWRHGTTSFRISSCVVFALAKVQRLAARQGSRPVFVEHKQFRVRRGAAEPSEAVIRGVTSLAKLLSQERAPEAGFRTLHCCGVICQTSPRQRFAFIFDLPSIQVERYSGLTSMTTAVSAGFAHRPTLGERFQMAVSLAKSLFQFHSVNWLHKSIRSANVLFVNEGEQHDVPRPDFHEPFLVGFEFSRAENDISTTHQDDSPSHNIYRHPDKQGPPEERFDVLHDIYALGTVLLEIGIWRPLLGFNRRFEGDQAML